MLEAIIFDFDGLIMDSESPVLQAWQEIYADYGVHMPVQDGWVRCIGAGFGPETFDPFGYLEARADTSLDWAVLNDRRKQREIELVNTMPPLPGVLDLLDAAETAGLKLAVASSSPHSWVDRHLGRLGLLDRFHTIVCADDVENIKPEPDLFVTAVRRLGVDPARAIVLEDSPHGVVAAGRAGIRAVAVPNDLTQYLDFDGAALRVESMAALSLPALEQVLKNGH